MDLKIKTNNYSSSYYILDKELMDFTLKRSVIVPLVQVYRRNTGVYRFLGIFKLNN